MEEVVSRTRTGMELPRKTGRFSRGIYDALLSTGYVQYGSQIAHGIADSLVTNAVAHAVKGGVLVFVHRSCRH